MSLLEDPRVRYGQGVATAAVLLALAAFVVESREIRLMIVGIALLETTAVPYVLGLVAASEN